jgi:hypothetical protein
MTNPFSIKPVTQPELKELISEAAQIESSLTALLRLKQLHPVGFTFSPYTRGILNEFSNLQHHLQTTIEQLECVVAQANPRHKKYLEFLEEVQNAVRAEISYRRIYRGLDCSDIGKLSELRCLQSVYAKYPDEFKTNLVTQITTAYQEGGFSSPLYLNLFDLLLHHHAAEAKCKMQPAIGGI